MCKLTRAILLIIVVLVLLLPGCSANPGTSETQTPSVAQVGAPAPDFQLQDLNGKTVSLSSLRGSPVMLNFWATWCPPCREEMPFIQQIYEEWSDRGLVLLAVDMGESPARVESFLQSYNLSLPVLMDIRQDVAGQYGIMGIPTTFFIDKDGILQNRKVGAFLSKEQIEGYLREIMP